MREAACGVGGLADRSDDNQDQIKQSIVEALNALWSSDALKFFDTERAQKLRPDILHRLLALAMTDDERAASLGLPTGCRVRESAKIISADNLECGESVWIGENAIVDASGGLTIGEHSTIGTGAYVWTHSSVLSSLLGQNSPGNNLIRRDSTKIGSRCFIGGPSVIYPGVTIGDECVILPMAVVTSDVPDRTMVGGAPAKEIRKIDEAWIKREIKKRDGL